MKRKKESKEKIINVPNFLTLLRFISVFVLIFMFVYNHPVMWILAVFIFAALTDFFDGQIARKFRQVTKIGAKMDIIADRMLWISSGIGIMIFFPLRGIFDNYHLLQMVLILTREIICFPFALFNLIKGKKIMVEARWSGKVTTFLQGFAIPSVILSVYSVYFSYSIFLAVVTSLTGFLATKDYLRDILFLRKNSS
jgi:CDP-diacylglycerol--glycerol-3-phosphate 3-phosphatidyltransferase